MVAVNQDDEEHGLSEDVLNKNYGKSAPLDTLASKYGGDDLTVAKSSNDIARRADGAFESLFFYYQEEEKRNIESSLTASTDVSSTTIETKSDDAGSNDGALTFTSASGVAGVNRRLTFHDKDSMALQAL